VHEKTLQGVQESENPLKSQIEAQEGQRFTYSSEAQGRGARREEQQRLKPLED
jgi:hypothetical protein